MSHCHIFRGGRSKKLKACEVVQNIINTWGWGLSGGGWNGWVVVCPTCFDVPLFALVSLSSNIPFFTFSSL